MTIRHHEDLLVWNVAIELAVATHLCVETFPRRHAFAYGDQFRRAAISVGANIAEGAARQHRREFLQFLFIARGSCAELHTLFVVARRLSMGDEKELARLSELLDSTGRLLTGLIRSVRSNLDRPRGT